MERPFAFRSPGEPSCARTRGELAVERTATMVHAALWWLSPDAHRIVDAIIARGGSARGSEFLAASLNCRNRHELRRRLVREGLPTLEVLAAWIRLLLWLSHWEHGNVALSRGALDCGSDYGPRFRTVKRLTGRFWSEVRHLGSAWALLELVARCTRRVGPRDDLGQGPSIERVINSHDSSAR